MSSRIYSPLYPSSSPEFTAVYVSREEFNVFYKIDRTLFSRLVFVLNRDLDQSFLAMGFFLLLEQCGYARQIVAYLNSLPDAFVDAVASEVNVCINVLYNQEFASTLLAANTDDKSIIPLLLRMTGERFTLRLINQNRVNFCAELTKHWNDVCARALQDIYESAQRQIREKLMALEREKFIEDMRKLRLGVQKENPNRSSGVQQENPNSLGGVQQVTIASPPPPSSLGGVQQVTIASPPPNRLSVTIASPPLNRLGGAQQVTIASPPPNRFMSVTIASPPPNRLGGAQQVTIAFPPPNRLGVTIASPPPPPPPVEEETYISAQEDRLAEEERAAVVEADDRTIFLTFSKGYPISEDEVRIFFTRRFGGIIEVIEMQEVEENEQPLYAKMVLKLQCASMLGEIVSAKGRNKYTINGKHVWARKYVRKNPFLASSSTHI